MAVIANPLRGQGIAGMVGLDEIIAGDQAAAVEIYRLCPVAAATPLVEIGLPDGRGRLVVKDESQRMGLGSFKALGATYAIARMAIDRVGLDAAIDQPGSALADEVLVCASAGNHGLSVAAGARVFGATAIVYLSEMVAEDFADRLRERGARVIRSGESYEESMAASVTAAAENGWTLVSDTSWSGYQRIPALVMEGYKIIAVEVLENITEVPTHVFLQAGVGGFAAAMASVFRSAWGDAPLIAVVEPESARCLTDSVVAGRPVVSPGPPSVMGRLDCKEPSLVALASLSRDADYFVTIDDETARRSARALAGQGLSTTPSGAAGVAGAVESFESIGFGDSSLGLAFVTEGPVGV